MKSDSENNVQFLLDMIALVIGVLFYSLVILLMGDFEANRADYLANNAVEIKYLFVSLPFIIGLFTAATVVIIRGLYLLLKELIFKLTENQE